MSRKRNIDVLLLVLMIVYFTSIFVFSLLYHLIDSGYSIMWIIPTISLLMTIGYIFVKRTWFLFFCIAPSLIFFTWLFIYHTIMNRGFMFDNFYYIMVTYVWTITSYFIFTILMLKIMQEGRKKYV